ncbi:MAG: ATP-binding protein [Planctomycetota bacterium]
MSMEPSFFDQMKGYVGFTEADVVQLQALGGALEPALDGVTDRFYERILADTTAAAILRESGVALSGFKNQLRAWLVELFRGPYDGSRWARTSKIGYAHVRVRLPQHYMVTAMNVLRTDLIQAVYRLHPADSAAAVLAINKVLDLELAVMLEAYRVDDSQKVRQAERQRMERRLEEVSHLANLGELAATLAHEIKNPLAGISGAIQVIGTALDPDDPRREIIAEILSQIDRLDRTARDLLIYARPKPPSRTLQDVSKLIRRTLRFLRQEPALHHIPIRFQGLQGDASARIDEPQLEQVITNLVLNAAHACEHGGDVALSVTADREYVDIEIADTGQGMTRDTLERAFEPFFTTKAKGTGLGLAICKRIVEAHHGEVTIQSREGEGTRVRIQLPK